MRSITGDAHLALLTDFWSTVLRATGRYKGNPLLAHFPLPIEERYFARWLTLFSESANEAMPAAKAAVILQKAELIASNMKRVLASRSDPRCGRDHSADLLTARSAHGIHTRERSDA
jgi:truncated hemoglobin YjbI